MPGFIHPFNQLIFYIALNQILRLVVYSYHKETHGIFLQKLKYIGLLPLFAWLIPTAYRFVILYTTSGTTLARKENLARLRRSQEWLNLPSAKVFWMNDKKAKIRAGLYFT